MAKARFLKGIETQGADLIVKTSPFVVSDRLALYKTFGTSAVVRPGTIRIPRHRPNWPSMAVLPSKGRVSTI